jgi:hypothetical protein
MVCAKPPATVITNSPLSSGKMTQFPFMTMVLLLYDYQSRHLVNFIQLYTPSNIITNLSNIKLPH